MFKVNNKKPFPSVSIVDFEKVNVSWIIINTNFCFTG